MENSEKQQGLSILMTTMSLNIGGAETHIVELASELARRGYRVTVASNGGVYVPCLVQAGVRHVTLPLHSKNPWSVLRAWRGLYRLLRDEPFNIVHSHARIPAFLCGMLARRLHLRHVTSVHGVFKVTWYWKLFTDWGDRSLAVSCDIKRYLTENYGIYPENITLTVNGIDTGKFDFHPEDRSAVEAEFGLRTECPFRLIYVSRIDRAAADVGFLLCRCAETLAMSCPGIEILMVGAGDAYDALTEDAARANASVGYAMFTLAGARTDVARLLSAGDAYIGVSRAALEAMAARLPCILAGAQGYIGLFTEACLEDALKTNFCCRGCGDLTDTAVTAAISHLYAMAVPARRKLGEYGREIVKQYYSVARMADDALTVYHKMMENPLFGKRYRAPAEVVISGYYGFGNTGDDSLLAAIVENIRVNRPGTAITVLSKHPKVTARNYNVRSINRFAPFRVLRELRSSSLFISGGGSLIQDTTSTRSLLYYLWVMQAARRMGNRVMLYASGIGPLNRRSNRKRAAEALEESDVITLRERLSQEEMRRLGVRKEAEVTADPAFSLEAASDEWIRYLLSELNIPADQGFFVIALRPWKIADPAMVQKVAGACRRIAERYRLLPLFVPMQRSQDQEISTKAAALCGGRVTGDMTAPELIGILKYARFVVGERLHMLIYGAAAGIPLIGLSYDPKTDAFFDTFGLDTHLDVRHFSEEELTVMMEEALQGEDVLRIREQALTLKKLAESDAVRVKELLNS